MMTINTVQLVIIGRKTVFRESMSSALVDTGRFDVASLDEHAEADAEFSDIRDSPPELILFHLSESAKGGMKKLRQLHQSFPDAKVVVLGACKNEDEILTCIEAGFHYIFVDSCIDELVHAVELVQRGEFICSPKVTSLLFSRLWSLGRNRRNVEWLEVLELTRRQTDIFKLVTEGLSNREIAARLCLSNSTVKNHVHHILKKLNMTGRAEIILVANRKNWLNKSKITRSQDEGEISWAKRIGQYK